jgi:hypothetical protein
MATSNLKPTLLGGRTKLAAIVALAVPLAWFTGIALIGRIEKHAAEDHLFVGTTANSHFALD